MGITLSMTGAFRETGASFFFVPKGALTHHRPRAGGGMAIGQRALLTKAPPGLPPEGPTMPQAVIAGAVGSAASRIAVRSCSEHTLRQLLMRRLRGTSSFREKKQKLPLRRGRRKVRTIWLFTIWRQRSSHAAQVVLPAVRRRI